MRFCPVLIAFLLMPNLFSQEPEAPSSSVQAPYIERQEKEFNFFPGGKIENSLMHRAA
jgi:hypothetical protein